MRTRIWHTLAVIREAIDDINTALAADPDNAYLQELLQKTYREELTVMRRVGGLTRSVMLRNDI
jgi:ferritin